MKHCPRCDSDKELSEFFGPYRKGYSTYCRKCHVAYSREWALNHPDRMKLLQRKHDVVRKSRKKDPERNRIWNRRAALHRYGLTELDYTRLLESQHGVCAICERPENYLRGGKVMRLAVDHDHVTLQVRGLLCHACNRAVGMFRESAELLVKAATYLRRHQANLKVVGGNE